MIDEPFNPNANLRQQLELAASIAIMEPGSEQEAEMLRNDALELSALVTDLHVWLQGGGFLPEEWQRL